MCRSQSCSPAAKYEADLAKYKWMMEIPGDPFEIKFVLTFKFVNIMSNDQPQTHVCGGRNFNSCLFTLEIK